MHNILLSLLIWIPIIGGGLVLFTGNDKNAKQARVIGLIVSCLTLLLCIPLVRGFDPHIYTMQFRETVVWIPAYNINYDIGIDGISLTLILLTAFTTFIVILSSWKTIRIRVAQFMAAFLIMQGLMIGVFAAIDSILFYVFWEGILIPMYLSIGIWGSVNRSYASIKFFLYTFFGSAIMLVALLYLYSQSGSFSILSFYEVKLSQSAQNWIFLAFFLAFAVKVPMWPVHTWLPDAHTEAPAGGSVVLAALMLKMGVYGFLRFSLPIVPDACRSLDWLIILLSLIAIAYIGLVAIAQQDMKKLIAYSSIAHMGFATLGCFMIFKIIDKTGNLGDAYMSLEGGMVQMISHAFSSGAMFVVVGILYDKLHTRLIGDYGGVANKMPILAAFFMLFAMANVGLPGTSGFVGEFMVILSGIQASFWITFFAATTLILSASYTLWMYKRVFFGKVANDNVESLTDIRGLDILVFSLLGFMTLFLGIYPQAVLNLLHTTIGHLLDISTYTKLVSL
ncbi:MAG: nuoM [Gammaproteobacteria bacterium]|jgi:NADH-quinone oxidoreductase subunit M|nr:nuoM [Gammaproteobacteria bacterium]